MFLDWKNHYCQNNYTIDSVQSLSKTNAFFTELGQKSLEMQKILNS